MSSLRPTARVARGATYLFIQGFGNAVIGLVFFSFLAHTFGARSEQWQMGVYALLNFIISLVQVFGALALPSAAIKYISQYLAEGDSEKAKAVVVRVLQVGLFSAVVAFLALFAPAEYVSKLMFNATENALLIRLVAIVTFFTILSVQVSGFLQGMQRMRDVAVLGLSNTLISTSLGIYLLLLGWNLYAVVFGWLIGSSVASIAGLVLTGKYLGVFGKPLSIRPLLNFSFPLYVSGGIGFFVSWVDQLLLVSYTGFLYGTIEAQRILGIYNVAIRAAVVPGLLSGSIVAALFPQLSQLYAQQGYSSLKDAFRVSTRYSVLIGFPLIVGLATLAYPTIIVFGGWQYIEAAQPLIIISIASLVGTLGVATGPILLTLERTRIASVLSVVTVVLSFSMSYFALAALNLGMVGTAWARTFASIIGLVLNLFVLTRYTSISFDREAIWKASVASVVLILSIFALDLVRKLLLPDSYQFLVVRLSQLPAYVVVGGVAYFICLLALKAIRERDIKLVEEYVPRRFKHLVGWLRRFAPAE